MCILQVLSLFYLVHNILFCHKLWLYHCVKLFINDSPYWRSWLCLMLLCLEAGCCGVELTGMELGLGWTYLYGAWFGLYLWQPSWSLCQESMCVCHFGLWSNLNKVPLLPLLSLYWSIGIICHPCVGPFKVLHCPCIGLQGSSVVLGHSGSCDGLVLVTQGPLSALC